MAKRRKPKTVLCSRCDWKPVFCKGLCRACYMYQYRHDGKPRPWSMITEAAKRAEEGRFR